MLLPTVRYSADNAHCFAPPIHMCTLIKQQPFSSQLQIRTCRGPRMGIPHSVLLGPHSYYVDDYHAAAHHQLLLELLIVHVACLLLVGGFTYDDLMRECRIVVVLVVVVEG